MPGLLVPVIGPEPLQVINILELAVAISRLHCKRPISGSLRRKTIRQPNDEGSYIFAGCSVVKIELLGSPRFKLRNDSDNRILLTSHGNGRSEVWHGRRNVNLRGCCGHCFGSPSFREDSSPDKHRYQHRDQPGHYQPGAAGSSGFGRWAGKAGYIRHFRFKPIVRWLVGLVRHVLLSAAVELTEPSILRAGHSQNWRKNADC